MKRISCLLVVLVGWIALNTFTVQAITDKWTKDVTVLPASSRQFITEHFPNIPVSHIQIEKDFFWVEKYEVILTDGTNIEFSSKGAWKDVKRYNLPVPQSIIPDFIQTYVTQHFPGNTIMSIEKDKKDYEIKLNNGLELTFDLQGRLIEIDD